MRNEFPFLVYMLIIYTMMYRHNSMHSHHEINELKVHIPPDLFEGPNIPWEMMDSWLFMLRVHSKEKHMHANDSTKQDYFIDEQ